MKTTFFGLTTFEKSMTIQDQAFQLVLNSGFPVVLGFEYYPVITLGRHAQVEAELVCSREQLEQQGFEICQTDRGGQATLHSPGQLVIYPLVPIRQLGLSVRSFVRLLEDTTVHWLQSLGIDSQRAEDAGIFTETGKIAFVGIRVQNGVTRHGISINISNDLKLFAGIKSCGIQARPLDSLHEHHISLDLGEAFQSWNSTFTAFLLSALPMEVGNSAHH